MGYEICAYTDRGGRPNSPNQDRIGVLPVADFAIVADGMGGSEDGALAAQQFTAACLEQPIDLQAAKEFARKYTMPARGATCFVSARIRKNETGNDQILAEQAGDCRLTLIDQTGEIVDATRDENLSQFNGPKNIVFNAIYGKGIDDMQENITKHVPKELPPGATALLTSDGIHSYADMEVLAEIIRDIQNTQQCMEEMLQHTEHSGDNRAIVLIRKPLS